MTRRLRIPIAIVLVLLVAASQGPRWWPALVAATQHIDWARVNAVLQQGMDRVGGWLDRGAAFTGWSATAFGAMAAGTLVVVVGAILLLVGPSRPKRVKSPGAAPSDRRQEVGRLARAGRDVALIARETRVAQDAVRSLITAR